MKRFQKDIKEIAYDTKSGITHIQDSDGVKGIKTMTYVAVEATKDGKKTYKSREVRHMHDLDNTISVWSKNLPDNRLILVYQSENYKFPKRPIESDLALVRMVPDLNKFEKIGRGYWSDKNVPTDMC